MYEQGVADSATGGAAGEVVGGTELAKLAAIFANVFDLPRVEPDDDFFALGGDSLIAATLVSEVEQQTGIGLSISALVESATPRALATLLSRSRQIRPNVDRILVPARTAGDGPTIFCIHGMDGESFLPLRFAQALRQDRPVWGTRALGLEPGEQPVMTVPAAASLYVAGITSVQQKGPYVLLGHCTVGTMIAWEMAQMLIAKGAKVAGVILLDPASEPVAAPFLHHSGLALHMAQARVRSAANKTFVLFERNPDTSTERRKKHLRVGMAVAAATYVPEPIACPVLLVYSSDRSKVLFNPDRGYQRLAADLKIVGMSCTHHDLLQARLEETVAEVRPFLDRVAPLS